MMKPRIIDHRKQQCKPARTAEPDERFAVRFEPDAKKCIKYYFALRNEKSTKKPMDFEREK